jgi:hypothetical protein
MEGYGLNCAYLSLLVNLDRAVRPPFQGDLSLFQACKSLKKLVALSMLIVDSSTQGDQIQ